MASIVIIASEGFISPIKSSLRYDASDFTRVIATPICTNEVGIKIKKPKPKVNKMKITEKSYIVSRIPTSVV